MNIGGRLLLIVLAVIVFLGWTRNAASRDAAPVDEAGTFTGRRYDPAIFPLYFLVFGISTMLVQTLMAALGILRKDPSAVFFSHLTVFIGVMVQISIYNMQSDGVRVPLLSRDGRAAGSGRVRSA